MTRERLDAVRARWKEAALQHSVSPRDVDLLLRDLLGRSQSYLIAHGEELIDAAPMEAWMQRRFDGEPLQYIRGRAEFYGREFLVDDRVLIPRPETEILVENALARAAHGARVVDIGTGSGCIAITMERERPDLRVIAVDASVAALAVARANAMRLGARVTFVACDVLTAIREPFDLIVSNPPYIAAGEVPTLAVEVQREPHMALTPGPRGTETIERIYEQARGAKVLLEIGYGQERAIHEVAEPRGYVVDTIVNDLAGIPRVVVSSADAQQR